MNELEEALQRARAELVETTAAVKAARGKTIDELAERLARLQAETVELDARATALEAELQPLREEEERALALLNAS